ncbi:MAG: hypothetical protein WCN98_05135, partial [Verrucomicrobiaceae bacterium]
SRPRVSEANEWCAKHTHQNAIERHQGHWSPSGRLGIPLSLIAPCVPLAADQPQKDSISLLQALDSYGRLRLVLTDPWIKFGRLTSYYIEAPGVGVSIHWSR